MGGGSGKLRKVYLAGYSHPVFIRGGKSSDAIVLYQIFGVGEYQPATKLNSVRFILDAGANIGLASLYFLRHYPGARILAVEPDSGNFALCTRNLAPYRDRVIPHHGAIWSHCGSLSLVPFDTEWGLAVRPTNPGERANIEAFDMPTLMQVADASVIDLLKMDIEGSEEELFRVGPPVWMDAVRNIAIEFHGVACERTVLSALRDFAYQRIRRPMMEFFLEIQPRALGAGLPESGAEIR